MPRATVATSNPDTVEIEYDTIGSPDDPALLLVMGFTAQLIAWDDDLCRQLADRGRYFLWPTRCRNVLDDRLAIHQQADQRHYRRWDRKSWPAPRSPNPLVLGEKVHCGGNSRHGSAIARERFNCWCLTNRRAPYPRPRRSRATMGR